MSSDSIRKVYLGAIANGFSIIGASFNFRAAMKTESVKFLLRDFTRIYESSNQKTLRTKTIFTLSMVEAAMVVLRSRSDLDLWERTRIILALRVDSTFSLEGVSFWENPLETQVSQERRQVSSSRKKTELFLI
jgi:hypothetical protein